MLMLLCAMQEFVERLHNNSQRFVPILDPGIPLLPGYAPYEDGLKRGIFISDVTGQPYIAEVKSYVVLLYQLFRWILWNKQNMQLSKNGTLIVSLI